VGVVVVFGVFYGYTYMQVSSAIDNLTMEPSDYQLSNLSIFPPSADLTVITTVDNGSGYDMVMNINLDLYADSTYVTTFTTTDAQIKANGISHISMTCHLGSEALTALAGAADSTPRYDGTITVTHKMLGLIPVTVTKTASDLGLS
jgi:hypothetical protein